MNWLDKLAQQADTEVLLDTAVANYKIAIFRLGHELKAMVQPIVKKKAFTPQDCWDVYLNGSHIDSVFYDAGMDAETVKRSLINHDGYDSGITVEKRKGRGLSDEAIKRIKNDSPKKQASIPTKEDLEFERKADEIARSRAEALNPKSWAEAKKLYTQFLGEELSKKQAGWSDNFKDDNEVLRVGDRVEVMGGSGLSSDKIGVIVPWSELPATNGRGVPNIPGHYKPVDMSKEVLIRYDDGELNTMFKDRVRKVREPKKQAGGGAGIGFEIKHVTVPATIKIDEQGNVTDLTGWIIDEFDANGYQDGMNGVDGSKTFKITSITIGKSTIPYSKIESIDSIGRYDPLKTMIFAGWVRGKVEAGFQLHFEQGDCQVYGEDESGRYTDESVDISISVEFTEDGAYWYQDVFDYLPSDEEVAEYREEQGIDFEEMSDDDIIQRLHEMHDEDTQINYGVEKHSSVKVKANGESYSDIMMQQEAIESSQTPEEAVQKLKDMGYESTFIPTGSNRPETIEECIDRVWGLYKESSAKGAVYNMGDLGFNVLADNTIIDHNSNAVDLGIVADAALEQFICKEAAPAKRYLVMRGTGYGNVGYQEFDNYAEAKALVDKNQKVSEELKSDEFWFVYDTETDDYAEPEGSIKQAVNESAIERQIADLVLEIERAERESSGSIDDEERIEQLNSQLLELENKLSGAPKKETKKEATGEPDQDYDHEFFDKIVSALEAEGFSGVTHREFDKYQGVYLNIPSVGKFWVKEVYFTGTKALQTGSSGYTFSYEKGTEMEHTIFAPERDESVELEVTQKDGDVDASQLVEYCKANSKTKKQAGLSEQLDGDEAILCPFCGSGETIFQQYLTRGNWSCQACGETIIDDDIIKQYRRDKMFLPGQGKKQASLGYGVMYDILPNGDLKITMDENGRKEAKEDFGDELGSDKAMYEIFESIVANGLMWVDPEQIGALTDAPILSDGAVNDQGQFIHEKENIWWFPNYQVESPVETLVNTGEVIFTKE